MLFKKNRIISRIGKILLPTSTVVILLITPLLYYSFNLNFYENHTVYDTNFTKDQQLKSVENIYNFLLGTEGLNTNLTNEEISHMNDVKSIFNKVFIIEIISIFIFLMTILSLFLERKIHAIMKLSSKGARIVLTLNLLIITSVILNFKPIFDIFHKIFFPQGNWAFDESSILIRVFPSTFFQAIVTNIFLTSAGISLVIIIVYFFYKKYRRNI